MKVDDRSVLTGVAIEISYHTANWPSPCVGVVRSKSTLVLSDVACNKPAHAVVGVQLDVCSACERDEIFMAIKIKVGRYATCRAAAVPLPLASQGRGSYRVVLKLQTLCPRLIDRGKVCRLVARFEARRRRRIQGAPSPSVCAEVMKSLLAVGARGPCSAGAMVD